MRHNSVSTFIKHKLWVHRTASKDPFSILIEIRTAVSRKDDFKLNRLLSMSYPLATFTSHVSQRASSRICLRVWH